MNFWEDILAGRNIRTLVIDRRIEEGRMVVVQDGETEIGAWTAVAAASTAVPL